MPVTSAERVPFRSGQQKAELSITAQKDGPAGWKAVEQQGAVVLGNGLACSRRVMAPLAHAVACSGVAVVTYDNPRHCHNLDDLAEQFNAIVRRVGKAGRSTLALYSQSSIAAARLGDALVAEAGVERFLFIAPAGVAPRADIPPDIHDVHVRTILHATTLMLHEAVAIPGRVLPHPDTIGAARQLIVNNIRHATRHPQAFKVEAHMTFRADERRQVVQLAGRVPVGVMAGTADTYFPHAVVQDDLHEQHYPYPVREYAGNHIDPLFSPRTAEAIVAYMQDLPCPAVIERVGL